MQVSTPNIKEILKIKKNFFNLSLEKIEEIHKIINNSSKVKLRINIITKEPSRQQIIIPISSDNITKFMSSSSKHITNINRVLKNIKPKTITDFVCSDH